ncbi:DUF4395 domain-containing protein [Spirosoma sp.]|uniref:DUF4395 domain-containing protein n=1 Tax=Spirosoma sp. TaxID=1899569 RepID=UPI003B3BD27B
MKNENSEPSLNGSNALRSSALECPIDGVKMNESKARTVAFGVLLLIVAFLLTSFWPILLFMLMDFALRAFNYGTYSPLARISDQVVRVLDFPVRLVDQAPKRFAAGVGLIFSITLLIVQAVGLNTFVLAGILAVFAALESLAGFCAGCYVYTFLPSFLKK